MGDIVHSNDDCHVPKAQGRCEGLKRFRSMSKLIRDNGEGVKRRLKSRKVRRTGIKQIAGTFDDTDMK